MAKYNVELLRPGKTTELGGIVREYTEEELSKSVTSLKGKEVVKGSTDTIGKNVVGQVLDARYQNGVQCTVNIYDDSIVQRIDESLLSIAPSMTMNSSGSGDPIAVTDITFRNLYLAPETSDLVGLTERIE